MTRLTESPFVVLVDTREQTPYTFASVRADANEGGGPLIVRTQRCTLTAGDYSIAGYAKMVVVERKTKSDLGGTLTAGRRRFMAELERLREFDAAWIVIEADVADIAKGFTFAPQIKPRSIFRSAMAWQLRYPNVHWWAVPGAAFGEVLTYQLLRMWWRERIEKPQREARARDQSAWRAGTSAAGKRRARDRANSARASRRGGPA